MKNCLKFKSFAVLLFAFLFLFLTKSIAGAQRYSCYTRNPATPTCNAGTHTVIYNECRARECSTGEKSSYTCNSHPQPLYCSGNGLNISNANEAGVCGTACFNGGSIGTVTRSCCVGEGGGDSGGSGISCPATGWLEHEGWIINPEGTHSKDAAVPVAYKAVLNDGLVGTVSIEFGRYGWQDPVRETACECWRQNGATGYICTNGCYILGGNPSGDRRAVVQIAHDNILELMRQVMWNRSRKSDILGGWAVRAYACSVNTNPNVEGDCSIYWPQCHTSVNITITDCTPTWPTPACTVTNDHCAATNSGNTEYKATSTGGELCKGNSASCTDSDGCGNTRESNTSACYKPETNTKPSTPTSINIGIDNWMSPNLSTNANSRTLIKYPFSTSPTLTRIPTISKPSTARDIGAKITVNGGIINKTTNENFTVNSQPVNTTLFQGDLGTIIARNYTLNKCDNNELDSDPRTGYYKVNTLPEVTSVEISGNDTTAYGCKAIEHTGIEANNPLTITVRGTDADSNSSINGVILWLVKDGTTINMDDINKRTVVGPGPANVDENRIGLFLPVAGGLYKSNNSSGTLLSWGRDTKDGLSSQPGEIWVRTNPKDDKTTLIEEVTLDKVGDRYEVKLRFNEQSKIKGEYKIYAGLTDTLSFVQESDGATALDQRSILKTITKAATIPTITPTWTFDFAKPSVTSLQSGGVDQRIAAVSWMSSDQGTGIPENYTVVNIYKESDQQPITRISPEPQYPKGITGVPESIGKLSPPEEVVSGWTHPIAIPAGALMQKQEMRIDIGDNQSGTLQYYVTAYDVACNSSGNNHIGGPNLDKWIATKGGIFYSKGRINYQTKTVGKINPLDNLGSELIATNAIGTGLSYPIQIIAPLGLNPFEPNPNPAAAPNIKDINDIYSPLPYEALLRNFELKKEDLEEGKGATNLFTGKETITCINPNGCFYITNEIKYDTTYTGKIIIIPENDEKDIEINADIKADDLNPDKNVLFVLSKKSIIIKGDTVTEEEHQVAHTDHIDAFLIAKDNIIIETGEGVDSKYQDRIEMTGSIIAFGIDTEDSSKPAFLLRRTLGLFNTQYPALTVNYHPKYSQTSQLFFGVQNTAYKREVGYKTE